MPKGNPKGNPQNLKPWPKGVSGNPRGAGLIGEDIRKARQLTASKFTEITTKYLGMTKEQLIEATKAPGTPALELMVAQIMSKAIINGDQTRLNFLLDRLIGKVPDKVIQATFVTDSVEHLLEEYDKLNEPSAT